MILFSKKQKLIPILIDYKVILYGWNIADTAYNTKKSTIKTYILQVFQTPNSCP